MINTYEDIIIETIILYANLITKIENNVIVFVFIACLFLNFTLF